MILRPTIVAILASFVALLISQHCFDFLVGFIILQFWGFSPSNLPFSVHLFHQLLRSSFTSFSFPNVVACCEDAGCVLILSNSQDKCGFLFFAYFKLVLSFYGSHVTKDLFSVSSFPNLISLNLSSVSISAISSFGFFSLQISLQMSGNFPVG